MRGRRFVAAATMLTLFGCSTGRDGTFAVNGHELYLSCSGGPGPTVVFEAALGGDRSLWPIAERIRDRAYACVYDRPGNGDSSVPDKPMTARADVADLHALLEVAHLPRPIVVVAWPVMRRAVLRIGEALAARGVIAEPDDVFFLARAEALAALGGERLPETVDVPGRRSKREEQARLVPPLLVGRVNRMLKSMWDSFPRSVGAVRSDTALVSGAPASSGRATGSVRVIRGPQEFDLLQPGEILVAPLTAPAWTPLFTRAAAVVTDVGSAASHASIIAREYGIPAVVGCGDATARLRTGMRVTVDGGTGNVEAE